MDSLVKKLIKKQRIKLLQLMAKDENWYKDETSNLYKEIMVCSKKLRILTNEKKKIRRITKNEYNQLKECGFTLIEIADYFDVSVSYLNKWRSTAERKND